MRLRRLIWFIPIVILLVLWPLTYVGISPLYIYIQHLVFSSLCYLSGSLMIYLISNRFSLRWKKASINEIRVEDSVLLEGIGVFQGTLFIYLSVSGEVVSSSSGLLFLRWTIPLVTALFYLFRGYGAIKNSPKYRLYSSLLLIFYMFAEVSLLFNEFASDYIPIYVNSTNITRLYFPSSANLVLFSFIFEIGNALSARYGYK